MTFEEWFGSDLTGQTYEGLLYCSDNRLTSLKGCPEVVNGNFSCSNNRLTSLEHCPKVVNGHFSCSHNQLTSLEYGPEVVDGVYYCKFNNLTSLHGLCYSKVLVTDFEDDVVNDYLMKLFPEMII